MLGGSAAALVAGTAASPAPAEPAPSPDAELVRLCHDAIACEVRADVLMLAVNDVLLIDPRWSAAFAEARLLTNRYHRAVKQTELISARTAAGLRAKADLVRVHMHPDQDDFGIVHSLVRDVLAAGA